MGALIIAIGATPFVFFGGSLLYPVADAIALSMRRAEAEDPPKIKRWFYLPLSVISLAIGALVYAIGSGK